MFNYKIEKMKKYVMFIVVAVALSSCSLIKSSSSKTLDVKTNASCNMEAELEVLPQKVSGIAYRQRGLKREKELESNAIADALKEVNADVLVEARFTKERKKNGKIKSISVSGYPAFYKNFQKVEQTIITPSCCPSNK